MLATITPINVEICLKESTSIDYNDIIELVREFLEQKSCFFNSGFIELPSDSLLASHLEHLSLDVPVTNAAFWEVRLQFHIYKLKDEIFYDSVSDDNDPDDVSCVYHSLPSKYFDGIWESLIFDGAIKQTLLSYASSALLFAKRGVDPNMISFNRVLLIYGPTGSGKSSLCKGLANKLGIQLSQTFVRAFFIEINSHSLFSKWFSESGNRVMKLFQKINELVDMEDCLVNILIDEVESIAAARKLALQSNEPADSIRVVNTLLQCLDSLRNRKNVLIFTTSNNTEAIDIAFVDRADIKQYIGYPSESAVYEILRTCYNELIRVGIVESNTGNIVTLSALRNASATSPSAKLAQISAQCKNFSGRAIRRLPIQAHSLFLDQTSPCNQDEYLKALELAIAFEIKSREHLNIA